MKEYDKDERVLELDCGRGIFLDFLIGNGYKNVFGIDVSKVQIDIAKVQNLNTEEIGVLESGPN